MNENQEMIINLIMNPQEQIFTGMKLIKNGCKKIITCESCPFSYYCDSIDLAGKPLPKQWEIKKED